MLKIAAIDVGSNAIRMVIGELDELWGVKAIENIRLPIRLGQDVFIKGRVEKERMQQTLDAFRRFQRVAKDFGVYRLRAIATSAMREASNADILTDRILRATGIEVNVIDGDEEARLIHMAVASALNIKNKRTLVIDIGGGSVEVTLSTGNSIIETDSYNMGTVRLLKKLDTKAGSKHSFSQLVREYAEAPRRRIDREIGDEKIQICAGTGGNVEEIGRLRQKLFKADSDSFIMLDELEAIIERLNHMSLDERIRKLKLRPDRADVILPACIVLHMIAKQAHVKQIAIPRVGLKDGILLDLAEELSRSPRPQRRVQIWESALHLGRKYQFDEDHAVLISKLASQLYQQSGALHNLDDDNLLLLQAGALLHDIGHFINTIDHDKHGYYLLKTNHLIGLSQREQEIVANLVRYHRNKFPSTDDDNFSSLPQKDRLLVTKLSALLRLADGMDVSHTGRITKLILKEGKAGWRLRVVGRGDLTLERWAIEKRKNLFQDIFGVRLEMD
jgi:exopolyphosphatase / guanosine-5'-triphosphate,3'-diphosphate pyrophosphatase